MIEISFQDVELRDTIEDRERAITRFGEYIAEQVFNRISDIGAVNFITELPGVLRPTFNQGQNGDECHFDLGQGILLVAKSSNNPPRIKPDKTIDWDRVNRIKIVRIG